MSCDWSENSIEYVKGGVKGREGGRESPPAVLIINKTFDWCCPSCWSEISCMISLNIYIWNNNKTIKNGTQTLGSAEQWAHHGLWLEKHWHNIKLSNARIIFAINQYVINVFKCLNSLYITPAIKYFLFFFFFFDWKPNSRRKIWKYIWLFLENNKSTLKGKLLFLSVKGL